MKDRPALLTFLALAVAVAACGSSGSKPSPGELPRLDFGYDSSAPLRYVDDGRIDAASSPLAVHDVSYSSGGRRVQGYLVLPRGAARRPAVIFVHGAGGDRSELLGVAAQLAKRRVVALTITAPSRSVTGSPSTIAALLAQARSLTVDDVIAVRRAVDLLQTLPQVDPNRIGYVGWSAGARLGAVVAAAEPRIAALVLVSAGADPLSAFLAHAPPSARQRVRRVLGSVDPLRYIAQARPGTLLIEDALLNVVHAAPSGTTVRWYDAQHALGPTAYRDAFDWLADKLHF